ncbi:unnamed protein product [Rotaria sp. Silwood1]|nr:unnamed protein product [Rotaria sp. Silwood1]CAF3691333.1 unnamed protein product [Rotaria sp. Silwood1]CAF3695152.1 unnamed protein product [Rotaria sp. Silwood1]CAF4579299.1 unnamed protein product [Rotaria sp. Silwood1]CAF4782562.1 unnamed protein product [Rotaria sp. Silwood1]
MLYLLIIVIYFNHHLLLHTTSASSLLFTLDNVRYSLSDRVLTIPKLGALRGIHIDYENEYYKKYNLINIEAFLGLQYGLYHGRFEPSKERFELHPTTKVNKQIHFGPACAQHIWINQSELIRIRTENFAKVYYPKLLKYIENQNEQQCLYMNIYQPQIKNLKEPLPVLLFIHGDGYDIGTGAAFDGAIFASYTKAIVVTINYRLGPFGFLYLSRESKGDYALHDIYTALHWLKNYVTHFNGDPDRITLYGTGSGAVLASLVVMLETVNGGTGTIKRRKSLVHRLILNDQTFLSPHMTSIVNDISSYQKDILLHLSCSTLLCLRNQSLIKTKDLLELNTYSKTYGFINYVKPLEYPFPFFNSLLDTKIDHTSPLRMKFYHQSNTLLPENLHILLTISSSINHSLFQEININNNNDNIIEDLINYAYTKWNITTNEYYFDKYLFNYHQQILAPLLKYAKYVSNDRNIHILERYSNKYQSELPYTFGYVLAPSMSVFNDTYLNADENERIESMKSMDLFANLIHNGDINVKSPYSQNIQDKLIEKWYPVFPEFNFILLKNDNLSQIRGYHAQVHNLFNNIILNHTKNSFDINLLNTWKTLYEVSHKNNLSTYQSTSIHSSLLPRQFSPLFDSNNNNNNNNQKYIFILSLSAFILLIINFCICIILSKRGQGCRKREYNCLNNHKQLTLVNQSEQHKHQRRHGGSSPSSTNSNGTITIDSTQQLIVNTNSIEQEHHSSPLPSLLCTTTNSSINSTPPIDVLHPVNITKKNGILKCSSIKKTNILLPSSLPEAIV